MVVLNFNEKYRKITRGEGGVYILGTCFIDDVLMDDEYLLNDLKDISDINKLERKLEQYNGFYAFCISDGNECFVAVDRIRSIPIFYGKKDSDLYISNDAEWVRQQVGDTKLYSLAEKEFLLTGYVTGQDTLYANVKQLQAGEYLYFNTEKNEFVTKRYYRFLHEEPGKIVDKEQYLNELDKVMDEVIKRLIHYANGRQIVIPLSGGRDSRLIALKLKQLEYQNILCFTYGVRGNFEAETSKTVARLLGFRWEYVEYTEKLWKEWFNSQERKNYHKMACNLTSQPHLQDFFAVRELKNRGILERDAIFVPGHSGDFPAGSHIPIDAIPDKKATINDLLNSVIEKHYSLLLWNNKMRRMKLLLQNRILGDCEVKCITNGNDYADAFEKWDWQERQAKFIVNSLRVYEYWGYDWYIPFWDNDFIYYFQKIPLIYRKDKSLYNEYVDLLYKKNTGEETHKVKKSLIKSAKSAIRLLLPFRLYDFIQRFLLIIRKKKGIFLKDPFNMYFAWAFSDKFITENIKKVKQIYGFYTIYVLEELKSSLSNVDLNETSERT